MPNAVKTATEGLRTSSFTPGPAESSLSRYRLIEAVMREQIVSGEYGAGDRLPSETELCAIFSASRPTVRQALGALEADNLVSREHGRGTFVKASPHKAPPRRHELSFDQLIEPQPPITITIQRSGLIKGYGIPHTMMNLPRGVELFYFVRIYKLGQKIIGGAKVHVLGEMRSKLRASDLSARNVSKTIAARSGKRLCSSAFTFDSTLAEPRYAEMVGTRAGAPLTSIRRTTFDGNEIAIEHTQLLLRPDMCYLVSRQTFDET